MVRRVILAGVMAWTCAWGVSMAADQEGQGTKGDVPKVVAKVNGKAISGEQYQKLFRQMESSKGAEGQPGKAPSDPQAIKEQVLERLITVEVLSQKAEQLKIQAEPQELDQKIQEIQESMGGEQAMKDALKSHGLSMEELRADIKRSMGIQKLLDREVFEKVTVDQGEVKGFYDSNPQVFQVPEQVRARHIIVRVKEGATEVEKKQARETIQKAAERLNKGESFEEVAKEVSQDGTAQRGGDLGYFSRGQMVPEFEKVAFSLEKGKVSPMVETKFGYHLIKLEDKKEARTLGFQEVEAKIAEFLRQRKGEEQLKAYVDGLRGQAKIERASF
jgi:peptidyl-prolyl cis-trans isomerase C